MNTNKKEKNKTKKKKKTKKGVGEISGFGSSSSLVWDAELRPTKSMFRILPLARLMRMLRIGGEIMDSTSTPRLQSVLYPPSRFREGTTLPHTDWTI